MVLDRERAALKAETTTTNVPDSCQTWTREIYGAPAAGDVDGDGHADAEDGWKSEPAERRHRGDRNPPRGVPVSYLGGSRDNGHRAISLGKGMIRSTDAGGRGIVATVPLDWPESPDNWGLRYVGWSETIDGVLIPLPEQEPAPNDDSPGDEPPQRKPVDHSDIRAARGHLRKVVMEHPDSRAGKAARAALDAIKGIR